MKDGLENHVITKHVLEIVHLMEYVIMEPVYVKRDIVVIVVILHNALIFAV
jgi:hypothetical protein